MERRRLPSRNGAEHRYDRLQGDWCAELLKGDPPDESALEDLNQQLLALEAYLTALGRGETL